MSHDLLFMREIVLVFGTAVLAAWVFRLLRTPTIIGFLFTGIFIGPSGLGLISQEDVAGLREVGLILLLFMIGLELVKDKESKEPLETDTMEELVMRMLNRGVLAFNCGRYNNVLRFMPSLIITREYAEKSLDILLDVAREVESTI